MEYFGIRLPQIPIRSECTWKKNTILEFVECIYALSPANSHEYILTVKRMLLYIFTDLDGSTDDANFFFTGQQLQ
jgi:hypothetical protein